MLVSGSKISDRFFMSVFEHLTIILLERAYVRFEFVVKDAHVQVHQICVHAYDVIFIDSRGVELTGYSPVDRTLQGLSQRLIRRDRPNQRRLITPFELTKLFSQRQ